MDRRSGYLIVNTVLAIVHQGDGEMSAKREIMNENSISYSPLSCDETALVLAISRHNQFIRALRNRIDYCDL